jgi:PknH-like extracellular domain
MLVETTASGVRVCAVVAALGAVAMLSGCVSAVSGTAKRGSGTAPQDVVPLVENQLDDVLLSIGELNGIVGATQMTLTSEVDDLSDHSSDVSDASCLGAIYGGEQTVYDGSDWTAARDQVAREPSGINDHWVQQTVVLYPDADNARKFFAASKDAWQACAGETLTLDDGFNQSEWDVDQATADGDLLKQTTRQQNSDDWGCDHALSVVSNATVEAWACSYDVGDEAAAIATAVTNNVTKAAR